MAWFRILFSTDGFPPRSVCGIWSTWLITEHVGAELVIALSYVFISLCLFIIYHKRRAELPFGRLFWAFGAFIIACAASHATDALMFYHPAYRLLGLVHVTTALISAATAMAMIPLRKPINTKITDVIESDERYNRLEETKRRLQIAMHLTAETMPSIVWTAREAGDRDFFNAQWYDYTGLTEAQSIGWGWKTMIHASDLERALTMWTQSLATGQEFRVEYRYRRFDGVYRWHEGRAQLKSQLDGSLKWIGVSLDVEDTIGAFLNQRYDSMAELRSIMDARRPEGATGAL